MSGAVGPLITTDADGNTVGVWPADANTDACGRERDGEVAAEAAAVADPGRVVYGGDA